MSRNKGRGAKSVRGRDAYVDVGRHPHLVPLTLSGLKDALLLNAIPLSWRMENATRCTLITPLLVREINPQEDGVLKRFFEDALCHHSA